MQIHVSGWGRNHGQTRIATLNVLESLPTPKRYDHSQTYLGVDSDGHITIAGHAANVRLGGDYLIQVFLRRDELVKLFRDALNDRSLNEVIEALSKAK